MTHSLPDPAGMDNEQRGHEPDTVAVRGMAFAGLGLFLLVVATLAGVAWAFKAMVPSPQMLNADREFRRQLTIPGVQPNQAYDRGRIAEAERASLSRYGWQDEAHETAQIPIDRAIELMARHKLDVNWPDRDSADSPAPTKREPE